MIKVQNVVEGRRRENCGNIMRMTVRTRGTKNAQRNKTNDRNINKTLRTRNLESHCARS